MYPTHISSMTNTTLLTGKGKGDVHRKQSTIRRPRRGRGCYQWPPTVTWHSHQNCSQCQELWNRLYWPVLCPLSPINNPLYESIVPGETFPCPPQPLSWKFGQTFTSLTGWCLCGGSDSVSAPQVEFWKCVSVNFVLWRIWTREGQQSVGQDAFSQGQVDEITLGCHNTALLPEKSLDIYNLCLCLSPIDREHRVCLPAVKTAEFAMFFH